MLTAAYNLVSSSSNLQGPGRGARRSKTLIKPTPRKRADALLPNQEGRLSSPFVRRECHSHSSWQPQKNISGSCFITKRRACAANRRNDSRARGLIHEPRGNMQTDKAAALCLNSSGRGCNRPDGRPGRLAAPPRCLTEAACRRIRPSPPFAIRGGGAGVTSGTHLGSYISGSGAQPLWPRPRRRIRR